VAVKNSIIWDVTLYSLVKFTCCLHDAGFVLGLPSDPEDRGDMFLQNVGLLLPENTAFSRK
jgi:hypothetical protein